MASKSGRYLVFSETYRSRNTPAQPWSTGNVTLINSYDMVSFNNGRGPYTHGDMGGLFILNKTSYKVGAGHFQSSIYDGPAVCDAPVFWGGLSKPLSSTQAQMNTFGTSAISKVGPTNPAFQGATFLAELREGAPRMVGSSLMKEKARDLRKVGDEYLNVEFGWAPFESDLRNFFTAVKNHKKILDQYIKDSNQKIRRRYYEPATLNYKTGSYQNNLTVFPSATGLTGMKGTVTETTEKSRWFSGAFRYHIPLGDSAREKFIRWESEANRLLGTRLTPEVVWNAAPWSWAADWFSNAGDVIHNISTLGHDGLVMQYGYAMDKTIHTRTVNGFLPTGVPTTFEFEEKSLRRFPATPYGFGLTWEGFSPKQAAVLAALGISKSPAKP